VKKSRQRKRPHIASSVDDFLKREGIFEEVEAQAIREVRAWEREQERAF
jgi:antitoxin HicB